LQLQNNLALGSGRQLFSKKEPFCFILQHIWLARSHKILISFYFSCGFIGAHAELQLT